ncbi:hypothetical protein C8F04DRAFT_1107135 [Mycena alexandri]|uniref:RING-type domain-containing protein n=1 Tax=Mycena alexandri TaxID=1745969 RepID=A0AAD6SR38_9AGAR|nr:hypothetical protein C8F04DRAFT_1107135 [Mycena alexandri]
MRLGHVFCRECIRRTVDTIKPCRVQHSCPTCRAAYNVVTIDPALIPPYLRPHVLPPLRPVFFDTSPSSSPASAESSQSATSLPPTTPDIPSPSIADLGRVTAEADALRSSCATWRRRAEVHAAANAGLLGFARTAKEAALRMRAERDAARSQCLLLKRKLSEIMTENNSQSQSQSYGSQSSGSGSESDLSFEEGGRAGAPARRGLPVFLLQQKATGHSPYDSPSRLGPPIKRRKVSQYNVPNAVLATGSNAVLPSGHQTACH